MLAAGGCEREVGTPTPEPPPPRDVTPELRAQIGELQKTVADQGQEIERQREELEAAQVAQEEMNRLLANAGTELLSVKDDLAVAKAGEAFEFAAVAALQQRGQWAEARLKYERFLAAHAQSPLAPHARRALQEVAAASTQRQAETKRLAATVNPDKARDDLQRKFRDGLLSVEELLAALKDQSSQQVLGLLGRPGRAFPNADEWGYNDAVINPETGRRGMLIVTFRSGVFAYLRVDYAGRKRVP